MLFYTNVFLVFFLHLALFSNNLYVVFASFHVCALFSLAVWWLLLRASPLASPLASQRSSHITTQGSTPVYADGSNH